MVSTAIALQTHTHCVYSNSSYHFHKYLCCGFVFSVRLSTPVFSLHLIPMLMTSFHILISNTARLTPNAVSHTYWYIAIALYLTRTSRYIIHAFLVSHRAVRLWPRPAAFPWLQIPIIPAPALHHSWHYSVLNTWPVYCELLPPNKSQWDYVTIIKLYPVHVRVLMSLLQIDGGARALSML